MAASEMSQVAVAVNRFGLGARPDEPLPTGDPRRWLLDQFARYEPAPPAWAALPPSATLIDNYVDAQKELRQADAGNAQDLRKKLRTQVQDTYRAAVNARVQAALTTPAPMAERLVHFWSNHFAVSVDKTPLAALAGAYEAEAIRPHVFGRFEDMLLAVERHPAMLLFLDQARSMGADSPAAMRAARPRGLNEHLAREIMELHTLGVRTGYDQQDVTEFARALTGWSVSGVPGVPRGGGGAAGAFQYRPAMHEPGARQVLGQRYEQAGEAQAAAVLHHLAVQPATAHHIAQKLARHFVGDNPPEAVVTRLSNAFQRSGGDLPTVYRALIESSEAWNAPPPKFKTPWEWAVSSLRGLGWRDLGGEQMAPLLTQSGQQVWRPGSPAGFDDVAESWLAPDALMRRVEMAQRLAAKAGPVDARALGPRLLPGGLGDATATAVARAESPEAALSLLLASPEFLRR